MLPCLPSSAAPPSSWALATSEQSELALSRFQMSRLRVKSVPTETSLEAVLAHIATSDLLLGRIAYLREAYPELESHILVEQAKTRILQGLKAAWSSLQVGEASAQKLRTKLVDCVSRASADIRTKAASEFEGLGLQKMLDYLQKHMQRILLKQAIKLPLSSTDVNCYQWTVDPTGIGIWRSTVGGLQPSDRCGFKDSITFSAGFVVRCVRIALTEVVASRFQEHPPCVVRGSGGFSGLKLDDKESGTVPGGSSPAHSVPSPPDEQHLLDELIPSLDPQDDTGKTTHPFQ
ncbi:hypothetical protein TGGT1_257810 [Toxoplasma gondii GT1]|uniref:Uncharacterized protein n=1 Tax=Toxoplasma gondii (strain ATCC 50853 / GT1) TaxID=507601 RepID=S7W7P1_TOXGG|nr:hypothetical protein TGGT1_257810 [Toxoplasma gondii GT1]